MNNIFNFILERLGQPDNNKRMQNAGTPDGIYLELDDTRKKILWSTDYARAFIYNDKCKEIIWSEPSETHNDILELEDDEPKLEKFGLDGIDCVNNLRYVDFDCFSSSRTNQREMKKDMKSWYEEHKHLIKHNFLGRIWVFPKGSKYNSIEFDKDTCYIAWWNELTTAKFTKANNFVVSDYIKHIEDVDISKYKSVDNNGNWIDMDLNSKKEVTVKNRDESYNKEIVHAWQFHTDTTPEGRKKKRELIHGYIKSRDEHFQREYYNKTKSKTAAEWHNSKTKRYNSKTHKMEWGEKIGDSLTNKMRPNMSEQEIINMLLNVD